MIIQKNELAPILLFCYTRLDKLILTVEALKNNYLALHSELFIFSDNGKTEIECIKVLEVRQYLKTIEGFRKIKIVEAEKNSGLANSIIKGVTEAFKKYDKVIVLEDDLITSVNFLNFMNASINFYQDSPQVFSISGYSFPIKGLPPDTVYFTKRASSWGWATWKDRWENIDWEVKDYLIFQKNYRKKRDFNKMGSDLSDMLHKQMRGKIDSWAIRWCYHQYKNNLYTVYPSVSKIQNIGFGNAATHTVERTSRYQTILDQLANTNFNFIKHAHLDQDIIKQFIKHYSLQKRAYYKILNLLPQKLIKAIDKKFK
jgi:hypothetical protein